MVVSSVARVHARGAELRRISTRQRHPKLAWCAVRPDTLFDTPVVNAYDVHASPTRSAIFAPGKTSRIQVAHFMATLITEPAAWNEWKGKMPVLYDRSYQSLRSITGVAATSPGASPRASVSPWPS